MIIHNENINWLDADLCVTSLKLIVNGVVGDARTPNHCESLSIQIDTKKLKKRAETSILK